MEEKRIKFSEKLCYGLGDVALGMVWTTASSYLSYYYTNSIGMAAATIGTIFLISRIFDGFSDLIMGIIVDKTKSKHGKARPWLLWMAIPFFIATLLLFSVPNIGQTGKIVYIFLTYNLLGTVVYTAINLPFGTLNTLITDNAKDRVSLNMFRRIGSMIVGVSVGAFVIPVIGKVGGEQGTANPMAWTIVMGILGALAMVFFFICFAGTKERVTAANREKVNVKEALLSLIHNKYWYITTALCFLMFTTSGFGAVNVYYSNYILGNENAVGLISMASMFPMIICLIIMSKLVSKIGIQKVLMIGAGFLVTGCVFTIIAPANMIVVIAGSMMRGAGMGALGVSNGVIIPSVIDYTEWKSGIRADGITLSATTMGSKLGTGLGAALVGWIMAWGKFDSNLAVQGRDAIRSIQCIYSYLPMIIGIAIFVLAVFYNLDDIMPQVRKELRERKNS